MKIHHEGITTIIVVFVILALVVVLSFYFSKYIWLKYGITIVSALILGLVLFFFRVPNRNLITNKYAIISPANGKVVVIKEVEEKEYYKDKRIQISIFMSPLDVHLNRFPIDGEVVYSTYHPGKYLVAWAPKSSDVNEHHSVVIKNNHTSILVKQIAGFLARRIVNYAQVSDWVKQNQELGFIKFGSRVDIFLPLNTKINVEIGQKTIEGVTQIASYE